MNEIFVSLCLIQALTVTVWAASCDAPPEVDESEMRVEASSSGTKVTYRCTTGRLFGEDTLFCNTSREWHAPPPACKEMCGKPRRIQHAQLRYSSEQAEAYAIGTKVHYKCSPGYLEKSGEKESICQRNFTWSAPSLVCVSSSIEALSESESKVTSRVATSPIPTPCQERGYSKKSMHEATSSSSKLPEVELVIIDWFSWWWSDPKHPHCPEPKVENGEIKSERKEEYSAKDIVVFCCSEGFQLEGKPDVICTEDGSWKPELPKCTKYGKASPPLPTVPNKNEFLYYGKTLEDLKPLLEGEKLSLEIQKLQLEKKHKCIVLPQ
ncbi:apolipoprotein R-like isoform X1 [Rhinatrema bivittatum]|uniref:apolipoprotein R-like isoform X1 n=1 Tax=Rhinatrema bivittatum TaxID=194408 RepID=UPI001126BFF8|nr:apolipoprotein R-like isoform X1 [Rhinatrema bivittatum]XP_029428368.1 apolipoprotein R-like isoform X1 [Rhinatrema bivittatum]XP_029428369.1 apolipoprotein R-like isoform X1 [Rhinatrema bivittatum]